MSSLFCDGCRGGRVRVCLCVPAPGEAPGPGPDADADAQMHRQTQGRSTPRLAAKRSALTPLDTFALTSIGDITLHCILIHTLTPQSLAAPAQQQQIPTPRLSLDASFQSCPAQSCPYTHHILIVSSQKTREQLSHQGTQRRSRDGLSSANQPSQASHTLPCLALPLVLQPHPHTHSVTAPCPSSSPFAKEESPVSPPRQASTIPQMAAQERLVDRDVAMMMQRA